MTQPAKVQEPSMEEILASIRRIIADDEAKPPAAAAPAAKAPVMNDIPPSAIPAAQAASAKAAPPPVAPAPPPAAPASAASNSQDDIDAMLAGLDEATSEAEIRPPLPDAEVFELTDEMAVPAAPQPSFHKIEPQNDLEFTESAAAKAMREPAFAPSFENPAAPPPQQILSRSTVSAVES